jgi:hypothetical protein
MIAMRLSPTLLCSVCMLLPAVACSPLQITGPGGSGGGSGAGGARGGPQGLPDSGPAFTLPEVGDAPLPSERTSAAACGLQKYQLEKLQPELLLVLDRSGSMNELAGMGQTSRWEETSTALIDVLTQTQGTILWGLKNFPNPSRCLVTPGVDVEIGPSTTPSIDLIRNTLPNDGASGTPTGQAVEIATKYLRSRATPNAKYLVLATDGAPACPPASELIEQRRAVAALTEALADDIPIATAGTEADLILSDFARVGGRARPGPQPYYPVENGKDLLEALAQISKVVASCAFTLEKEPPSPDDVAVDVDGMRITRDPTQTSGWNYRPGNRAIVLYGPVCDRVKSGQASNVDIIFGCPHVPIP